MSPTILWLSGMRFGSLGLSRFLRHGNSEQNKKEKRRFECLVVVVFTNKLQYSSFTGFNQPTFVLQQTPICCPFVYAVLYLIPQLPSTGIVMKLSGVLRAVSYICQITSVHPSIPLDIPCPKVYTSKPPKRQCHGQHNQPFSSSTPARSRAWTNNIIQHHPTPLFNPHPSASASTHQSQH